MKRLVLFSSMLALCTGCSSILQSDLDEDEANEIVLVLAEAGVEAQKISSGANSETAWSVKVSEDDLSKAWRILRALGLPKPRHEGFRSVYRERALVPGKMEEHALFLSALQEEMAATLEKIEGVVSARVHVARKSESRFGKENTKATTASVLICYRPDLSGAKPISEEAVGKLLANAVVGLEPGQVAVVFTPKRQVDLHKGQAENTVEGLTIAKKAAVGGAGLVLCFVLSVAMFRRKRLKFFSKRSRSQL
jgi:type III secretion protein J